MAWNAEEVADLGRHRGVVLPRRRDHHHHGVVQRVAAEVEQLEHLVEAGRVGRPGRADRERPLDTGQQRAVEHRLARPHPVLVALDGVDLAVVGDEAVRVGERPRRERVGREPGVHQQQRRLDARVGEIGEELAQLGSGEHPLVDDRARRQRREVGVQLAGELAAAALAGDERLAVEVDPGGRGVAVALGVDDEQLLEQGHRGTGGLAQAAGVDRERTPAEGAQPGVLDGAFDQRLRLVAGHVVGRQEGDPGGVCACRRELEVDHGPVQRVRHLDQDARTVAGVRFGARRTTMLEVRQRAQAGGDELVARHPVEVGDERDAARVVLETRVVEAVTARRLFHFTSTKSKWACVDARDSTGPSGQSTLSGVSHHAEHRTRSRTTVRSSVTARAHDLPPGAVTAAHDAAARAHDAVARSSRRPPAPARDRRSKDERRGLWRRIGDTRTEALLVGTPLSPPVQHGLQEVLHLPVGGRVAVTAGRDDVEVRREQRPELGGTVTGDGQAATARGAVRGELVQNQVTVGANGGGGRCGVRARCASTATRKWSTARSCHTAAAGSGGRATTSATSPTT